MIDLPRPVIAGNWKMNLGPSETRRYFSEFLTAYPPSADRSVLFFPPAVSLTTAFAELGQRPDVHVGVQNIYWEAEGAFTGEISAAMAAEAGAELCLVGHSERRQLFGETSEDAARKVSSALKAGLVAVLCVGETLEQRENGAAQDVVSAQLAAVFDAPDPPLPPRVLIAYEPVWAIGTGRTASPDDAAEMHGGIRRFLCERLGDEVSARTLILYGGSVKPENAAALLSAADVDGVLVGGASLDPAGFARICTASG